MGDKLLPAEEGTRFFFGKLYHWVRENGQLRLVAGKAES